MMTPVTESVPRACQIFNKTLSSLLTCRTVLFSKGFLIQQDQKTLASQDMDVGGTQRGCGDGSPSSPREESREKLCPLPKNFLKFYVQKWSVLVHFGTILT